MLLKSLDLAADGRKTGKMGKTPLFQPSHCWNVSAPSLAVVSSMMFLGTLQYKVLSFSCLLSLCTHSYSQTLEGFF